MQYVCVVAVCIYGVCGVGMCKYMHGVCVCMCGSEMEWMTVRMWPHSQLAWTPEAS